MRGRSADGPDTAPDAGIAPERRVGTLGTVVRLLKIGDGTLRMLVQGNARVRLTEAIALEARDHFSLRSLSPVATVGGGVVLDAVEQAARGWERPLRMHCLGERGQPRDDGLGRVLLLEAARLQLLVGGVDIGRQRGALDDKVLELMDAVEQTQNRADEKTNSL